MEQKSPSPPKKLFGNAFIFSPTTLTSWRKNTNQHVIPLTSPLRPSFSTMPELKGIFTCI